MLETLTIGQMVIQNMAIGCGHKNQGTFSMADGLLGVGCGSMSFVNQLSLQTGGAFSYCLATWDSRSPGCLRIQLVDERHGSTSKSQQPTGDYRGCALRLVPTPDGHDPDHRLPNCIDGGATRTMVKEERRVENWVGLFVTLVTRLILYPDNITMYWCK
ncbi:hypothetical protein QYF36_002800 [Acer negundo]|nr:hypothetical protein QYF36_002800 [Acer negundo]